jgi:hypothetical protein
LDGRTGTNDGRLIDKAPGTREKDMEKRPKKAVLAAISAAVTNYIKTQEEALATAAMAAAAAGPAAAAGSFYAAYGRQQMMEMRRLLSLRLARR